MKIGIFDSGIGGLSVLHHATKMLKKAKFIYYADTKHVPYGEKNAAQIKLFLEKIMNFFAKQNVDAVVIACNTASSLANKEFRDKFNFPIIAMEPAVKKAAEIYPDKKILVAATNITINGEKLANLLSLIDKKDIDLIALGELVKFAENTNFDDPKIKEYLQSKIDLNKYDVLVLGCTHFNYFKKIFLQIAPNIKFIDGNKGTINQLIRKLNLDTNSINLQSQNSIEYYFSDQKATKDELKTIQICLNILDEMYEI